MSLFDELTPEVNQQQVNNQLSELQSWLFEVVPDIDPYDPIIVNAVLAPWVRRLAESQNRLNVIERYGRLSINQLIDLDPSIVDEVRELIAELLGLDPVPPSFAFGEIRVITDSQNTIILPAGTRFSAGSVTYVLENAQTLKSAERAAADPNSKPLLRLENNRWYSNLLVVSEVPGQIGNISAGTKLTADIGASSIVDISAATNFVGGRDSSVVDDLIQQVRNNTFTSVMGTRDQIVSFLQRNSIIGGVRQVGVVGFGDIESSRGKHPFLPMYRSGIVDLYLTPTYYPVKQTIDVESVVVGATGTTVEYQFSLSASESGGFYKIDRVVDTLTGNTLKINSDIRGLALTPSPGVQLPILEYAFDAGFSAFQTATIRCVSTTADVSVGQSRMLNVTLVRVPGLESAQRFVSSRNVRSLSGDILLKAAIPIFLAVKVRLQTQFETLIPDIEKIQTAVSDSISQRPMRAVITVSDIAKAVSRYLPDDMTVISVDFDGELIFPDGDVERLTGVNEISCPHWPDRLVTSRTTAFYCSPSDVTISINKLITSSTP